MGLNERQAIITSNPVFYASELMAFLEATLELIWSRTFSTIGKYVIASHSNAMHSKCYGLWKQWSNVVSLGLVFTLLPQCDLQVLFIHACLHEIMSSLSFDASTLMWPWLIFCNFKWTCVSRSLAKYETPIWLFLFTTELWCFWAKQWSIDFNTGCL